MREALEMREHWSRRVPSFAPTETLTLGAAPSTAHEMIKTGRQPSAWMNTQPGENGEGFGEAPHYSTHVTALISVLIHVRQAPNPPWTTSLLPPCLSPHHPVRSPHRPRGSPPSSSPSRPNVNTNSPLPIGRVLPELDVSGAHVASSLSLLWRRKRGDGQRWGRNWGSGRWRTRRVGASVLDRNQIRQKVNPGRVTLTLGEAG